MPSKNFLKKFFPTASKCPKFFPFGVLGGIFFFWTANFFLILRRIFGFFPNSFSLLGVLAFSAAFGTAALFLSLLLRFGLEKNARIQRRVFLLLLWASYFAAGLALLTPGTPLTACALFFLLFAVEFFLALCVEFPQLLRRVGFGSRGGWFGQEVPTPSRAEPETDAVLHSPLSEVEPGTPSETPSDTPTETSPASQPEFPPQTHQTAVDSESALPSGESSEVFSEEFGEEQEEFDEELEDFDEESAELLPPGASSQLERSSGVNGEKITGFLRGDFAPNQTKTTLFIAICPPFLRCPSVECFPAEGDAAVEVTRALPHGVTLTLKKSRRVPFEDSVILHFTALEFGDSKNV